jgi:hypothetical protein
MRLVLILLSLAFALAGAALSFAVIFGPDWTSILVCVTLFVLSFVLSLFASKLPCNIPKWLETAILLTIILSLAFVVFNSTFRFWK